MSTSRSDKEGTSPARQRPLLRPEVGRPPGGGTCTEGVEPSLWTLM